MAIEQPNQSGVEEKRTERTYASGGLPGGTCACGRPDPGIKPDGGCWCVEDPDGGAGSPLDLGPFFPADSPNVVSKDEARAITAAANGEDHDAIVVEAALLRLSDWAESEDPR